MVIVCAGPSSASGWVHDHVPELVPVVVSAPVEGVSMTRSPSASEKLPELGGFVPSLTTTAGVSTPTAGGWLAGGLGEGQGDGLGVGRPAVMTHVSNVKTAGDGGGERPPPGGAPTLE